MTRYRVTVSASDTTGARGSEPFIVQTDDPEAAYRYGTTARAIASAVAADYCDSGSVSVVNVRNEDDRASVGRR